MDKMMYCHLEDCQAIGVWNDGVHDDDDDNGDNDVHDVHDNNDADGNDHIVFV